MKWFQIGNNWHKDKHGGKQVTSALQEHTWIQWVEHLINIFVLFFKLPKSFLETWLRNKEAELHVLIIKHKLNTIRI